MAARKTNYTLGAAYQLENTRRLAELAWQEFHKKIVPKYDVPSPRFKPVTSRTLQGDEFLQRKRELEQQYRSKS